MGFTDVFTEEREEHGSSIAPTELDNSGEEDREPDFENLNDDEGGFIFQ